MWASSTRSSDARQPAQPDLDQLFGLPSAAHHARRRARLPPDGHRARSRSGRRRAARSPTSRPRSRRCSTPTAARRSRSRSTVRLHVARRPHRPAGPVLARDRPARGQHDAAGLRLRARRCSARSWRSPTATRTPRARLPVQAGHVLPVRPGGGHRHDDRRRRAGSGATTSSRSRSATCSRSDLQGRARDQPLVRRLGRARPLARLMAGSCHAPSTRPAYGHPSSARGQSCWVGGCGADAGQREHAVERDPGPVRDVGVDRRCG